MKNYNSKEIGFFSCGIKLEQSLNLTSFSHLLSFLYLLFIKHSSTLHWMISPDQCITVTSTQALQPHGKSLTHIMSNKASRSGKDWNTKATRTKERSWNNVAQDIVREQSRAKRVMMILHNKHFRHTLLISQRQRMTMLKIHTELGGWGSGGRVGSLQSGRWWIEPRLLLSMYQSILEQGTEPWDASTELWVCVS